ncbi:hypothetical protein JCM3774_000578 [Rhodotorula dairenensis]
MAQQQPHVAQYGFNAPSPANVATSATGLHHHHQQTPPGSSNAVDPAILFGYSATASGIASPLAGSTGARVGMYGSSSVLSDADLDFENILASLNSAAQQQHSAGSLPHGYVGAPIAGLQSGANHLRHQSPLAPVNENGTQLPAGGEPVEYFSQPQPPKPRRGSAHEFGGTPNAHATNASYGASPSDTSSKRSVSQERTGRLGRSSSSSTSGVGKAPRQTSRSRSARRTSSAATAGYQDRSEAKERGRDRDRSMQREVADKASPASNLGTPAASAATPGASSASGSGSGGGPPPPPSHPDAPAAVAAAMGTPTSNATMAPHPYAMSMPGFVHPATYGAHAASLPTHAGGWFPAPHPSSGAMPLGMHHHHPAALAAAAAAVGGGGAFATPPHFMAPHPHHPMAFDPLTGWRPTVGPLPASAPPAPAPHETRNGNLPATSSAAAAMTERAAAGAAASTATGEGGASGPSNAGGSKKNKGLEDVLEEDDGKGDHVTDKRRKRRESHNAVERRRRDNINDRIAELASLLPEAFQVGAPPPPLASTGRSGDELLTGAGSANGPGSPAIGSLSLMSPGPTGAFGSGSPTSLHSVSGAAYMAAAAAAGTAAGSTQKPTSGLSAQAQAAAQKPNKGAVLAKSVDYIRYLQQVVELQQQQAAELQRQNAELRRVVESSPSPPSSHSNYLPPQPPCFPPHVHHSMSASASATTSASVSRQAASPVGGGPRAAVPQQHPPPPSGLSLSFNDEDDESSPSTPAALDGKAGKHSTTRGAGADRFYHLDSDGDDDLDDRRRRHRGGGYGSDPLDDDPDEDDGGRDGEGGAFTPECEGPDGIDCEKGWDAMLAAGGMHVLKMEEDDP